MHPRQHKAAARGGSPRLRLDQAERRPISHGPRPEPESLVAGRDSPTEVNPRDFGLVKAAYSVNETLSLLSIGRTSLYKLVSWGALKPAKLGKKTLFYASDIASLLVRLREAA